MKKLSKTIKTKWVKALRSGKYVQGKNQLCVGVDQQGRPEMCCLGVLEHVLGTPLEDLTSANCPTYPRELDNPKSPKIMLEQSNALLGDFKRMSIPEKLATYNDGKGMDGHGAQSFNWIASYIERYL